MCGCLLCSPDWGPGLQPRHVPWLGIKLAILWFAGRHSIHWATPARAQLFFILCVSVWCFSLLVLYNFFLCFLYFILKLCVWVWGFCVCGDYQVTVKVTFIHMVVLFLLNAFDLHLPLQIQPFKPCLFYVFVVPSYPCLYCVHFWIAMVIVFFLSPF